MPYPEPTACRIGIYGGTFSPPHNGHIRAALAFLNAARLDVLYVMPAAQSPHKAWASETDAALRLAMVRSAFSDADPRIIVSDYEIRQTGISYTYRTLTYFSETKEGELFLLCGTDTFLSLDKWLYPERIFALSTVGCIMRENDPAVCDTVLAKKEAYRQRFCARTMLIPVEPLELSSSRIRQMVREGKDVSGLVPAGVYRIIAMHNLYRSDCV